MTRSKRKKITRPCCGCGADTSYPGEPEAERNASPPNCPECPAPAVPSSTGSGKEKKRWYLIPRTRPVDSDDDCWYWGIATSPREEIDPHGRHPNARYASVEGDFVVAVNSSTNQYAEEAVLQRIVEEHNASLDASRARDAAQRALRLASQFLSFAQYGRRTGRTTAAVASVIEHDGILLAASVQEQMRLRREYPVLRVVSVADVVLNRVVGPGGKFILYDHYATESVVRDMARAIGGLLGKEGP